MAGGLRTRLAVASVAALLLVTGVAGAAGSPLFDPYQAVAVGSWPTAVAIGDVTGDGRSDVLMTTHYDFDPASDYRLWVFAQAADGTLAAPVSYATSASYTNSPDSVAAGDLNGDGRLDVVVGLDGLGVEVFPQLASGTLGVRTLYPTNDGRLVRLGHLDGDGNLDVAAVGWGTNTVSVLRGDGAGGLLPAVQYAARHAGYDDLEVGDVSGDGREDLVVMSGQSYSVPNVSVLAQLPAGGFGAAAEYRVADNVNTHGVGLGDVTGDGRNDLVLSYGGNRPSSQIAVFAQTEAGTLASPVSYASYDIPEPVDVADLDLDGLGDVVTLHGGWLNAGVYRQQANGTLIAEELYQLPYASHYEPHGLAVGDINGDEKPDLAVADYNQGLVTLRNAVTEPPTADVGVDVAPSAQSVRPRKSFWFDFAVTNSGPDATSVSLAVQLAGQPTNLTESDPNCTLQEFSAACTFVDLAPGATVIVRISGIAPKKGTVTATASVDAVADDPNVANDTDSASIRVR